MGHARYVGRFAKFFAPRVLKIFDSTDTTSHASARQEFLEASTKRYPLWDYAASASSMDIPAVPSSNLGVESRKVLLFRTMKTS